MSTSLPLLKQCLAPDRDGGEQHALGWFQSSCLADTTSSRRERRDRPSIGGSANQSFSVARCINIGHGFSIGRFSVVIQIHSLSRPPLPPPHQSMEAVHAVYQSSQSAERERDVN